MIFWIGFTLMFFNEGFVMMRHVSPWFAKKRDGFIKRFGDNIWYRLHGTIGWLWISFVTCGLIVNSNRIFHIIVLAIFWGLSFGIFYLPRWIKRRKTLINTSTLEVSHEWIF